MGRRQGPGDKGSKTNEHPCSHGASSPVGKADRNHRAVITRRSQGERGEWRP